MSRRKPVGAGATWVCSSVGRTARTPSIVIRTKEEQQISIKIEFGIGRRRIRVREFLFVSIELVAINRLCHLVYIE
jgi:hypothetical protein